MTYIKFTAGPVYVGHWQIGGPHGLRLAQEKRPSWWHRFMSRTLFGIVWVDHPAKPTETTGP